MRTKLNTDTVYFVWMERKKGQVHLQDLTFILCSQSPHLGRN
ncbi:hypothetical protein FDUTEX481_01775 [Tolypothrix sp. PCC 7601]|nr:hypothetical protein FDUTEX481_01775 [Tolypothrix sp. PCC 7601]